jgi:hypothetical protein
MKLPRKPIKTFEDIPVDKRINEQINTSLVELISAIGILIAMVLWAVWH